MRIRPTLIIAFVLVALSVVASQSLSAQTPASGMTCLAGKQCQNPTLELSFLLPAFLVNANWDSTVVIVNENSADSYADLTMRDSSGEIVAKPRTKIPGRSHVNVDIASVLAAAHSGTETGSIEVSPATDGTGTGIIAQVSMTFRGVAGGSYVDFEPTRPNANSSLELRAVGDSSALSPIVAITSTVPLIQHVAIRCARNGSFFNKTITLPSNGTVVTRACETGDAILDDPTNPSGSKDSASGLDLVTDGPPGSFAALGLVPHIEQGGITYTGAPFSDPRGSKTASTAFAGVPVGDVSIAPGSNYIPRLSVANFSTEPATVTVQYSLSSGRSTSVKNLASLTVVGGGTASVDLEGLVGSPDVRSSFVVTSNLPPGELVSSLISRSPTGVRTIEMPGKDLQNAHNGGNHPWSTADGNTSTAILFNETSSPEPFTLLISSGSSVWKTKLVLGAFETRAVEINHLIANQIKDDAGHTIPVEMQSGQANWVIPGEFGGTGRVLQINQNDLSGRSFSCGTYSSISGGDWTPAESTIEKGAVSELGSLEAQVSLSEQQCSCSGTYVGDSSSYSYLWLTETPSTATISGADYDSAVNVEGVAYGNAEIEGQVCDSCGCDWVEVINESVTPKVVFTSFTPDPIPISVSQAVVAITVDPSATITLTIVSSGSGRATFSNNSTSTTISESTSVDIVPTALSSSTASGPDLQLEAFYNGTLVASVGFSVTSGACTATLKSTGGEGLKNCPTQVYTTDSFQIANYCPECTYSCVVKSHDSSYSPSACQANVAALQGAPEQGMTAGSAGTFSYVDCNYHDVQFQTSVTNLQGIITTYSGGVFGFACTKYPSGALCP
ncbi:MAG: hypothetical protein WA823_03170 [Candidatus Acidiferrales bacterium]